MVMETTWLKMKDNTNIFIKTWMPKNQSPQAIVQLSHGMVEHISRYNAFAQFLADHGFLVIGNDHRGHGQTGEQNQSLGYFTKSEDIDTLVEDLNEVTTYINRKFPTLPVYLLGHSMGSFLARRYLQKRPAYLDGVILSGSGFQSPYILSSAKKLARFLIRKNDEKQKGEILNRLTFLGYNKKIKNNSTVFDWLTRDPTIIEEYLKDDYCGFTPTNQFFFVLYDGIEKVQQSNTHNEVAQDLPILLISGEEDPVGNYGKGLKKLMEFYVSEGFENLNLHLYPNGRHEILNEINRHEVFQDVLDWLTDKMKNKK
ncbi:alpha-beta hydrolase superfamily lysophospholipase [Saliterribacillus persicus]|uniref:Alpha-beta hydrolase superfamily lysophospholipase n=2 Tax=Saliterribacillus persicus TaxID=930114 RepID=A0A368XGB0_9BACI|nr:alpha-beta hydrolase superfamily lysophospholipase [Saliterribacillus persicus]